MSNHAAAAAATYKEIDAILASEAAKRGVDYEGSNEARCGNQAGEHG